MLARWSPFSGGIARPSSPMSVFDQLFNDFAFPRGQWAAVAEYAPAADVLENQNEIEVKVDLPGHDPKNVQIKLENGVLTIQSERRQERTDKQEGVLRSERNFGAFSRSFSLPDSVDPQKVEARFENGVLTITLPKREETKPRAIQVKVQS